MNSSRISKATVVAATFAIALFSGCGSDSGNDSGQATSEDSASGKGSVKVWLTSGEQFNPVDRSIDPEADAPLEATRQLLAGPKPVDRAAAVSTPVQTTIPEGVELRNLEIESGRADVRLSADFLGGIPAEPASRTAAEQRTLDARAAQVTYTLTQFGNVNSARIQSGGVLVTPQNDRGDFAKPANRPKPPKNTGGGDRRSSRTFGLQQKLADLGYLAANDIDGIAGYQTEQAVTAFQSWQGLDRDGVAGPATRAALRNAGRPRPSTKSGPKRFMEVHIDKGVLLMVKSGVTLRAIHVSAGAPATPTPAGRFRVFRKELMSWSVPFSSWLPYASYFNGGIAFHEYADVPNYPASHGCVRVPGPEAARVYRFAKINRLVVVKG